MQASSPSATSDGCRLGGSIVVLRHGTPLAAPCCCTASRGARRAGWPCAPRCGAPYGSSPSICPDMAVPGWTPAPSTTRSNVPPTRSSRRSTPSAWDASRSSAIRWVGVWRCRSRSRTEPGSSVWCWRAHRPGSRPARHVRDAGVATKPSPNSSRPRVSLPSCAGGSSVRSSAHSRPLRRGCDVSSGASACRARPPGSPRA